MIEICMFGPLRVYDNERQLLLTDFHGIKPRHVLEVLALHRGHPVSKERLADLLWHGKPPASWLSTLEGYVSLLRRDLAAPDRPSVIITRNGGYLLDASRVKLDLSTFDSLLGAAEATEPTGALELLTKALDLVRGDVLVGERSLPWVLEARERYQQRVRHAIVRAGRLALQAGDVDTAARHGQAACDLDPLAEDGWQIVIEAQWRAARRSEALRSFSDLRSLLDRELGIAPCRSLQQLVTKVLRDEPLLVAA